ncbi:tripartite tricarboxylate transporter permease [Salipiger abyssi]|uniref:tripartite tricarboxylate transporter permease n=1 Tax=Salipiger abyssi TaxID=1250539 RepID=UPI001A8FCABA|nr:tripartite tricarboxylate transporter permease [Salipiger abyssi]MBN9888153.1 tripartite tricarboxylate transporter permease [Salipiger abyssi]
MELIQHLELGLSVALAAENILYCFLGVLMGTLIGVLPGIGPVATIALLLPITYGVPPESALVLLAGIYYGAQYGGSTTAILLSLPGESSAAVTVLDGYQMAQQGRAGAALATAALGSFFAGTVATFVIALASPPLTKLAMSFGAAEYFSLMVLGLLGAVSLASGSVLRAITMAVLGILLGLVGQDVYTGVTRMTMDIPELMDGVSFSALAMGIFGLGEVVRNLRSPEDRTVTKSSIGRLMLSWQEIKQIAMPVVRGTGIGSVLGVLPGGGSLLSSFVSYTTERKMAKDPSRFGKGAIEGVAGPESANNAGAQTSFIPMLTLGIPSNPVMAMMIGALIIQGITPGPNVINERPELFWGVIASMWLGNLMLVVLNLPLIGVWVRLLTVPYRFLFPAIVGFCCIGVFSVTNSGFGLYVLLVAFIFGFIVWELDCEPAPLLLGFLLGPMLEENFRRAMLLAHGEIGTFVVRPISAGILLVAVVMILIVALPNVRKSRNEVFVE